LDADEEGFFPELPVIEWTRLERSIVTFFMVMVI